MIIDIDMGNTRVKWRLLGEQLEVLERGWCLTDEKAVVEFLESIHWLPNRVRVASVAGSAVAESLEQITMKLWGVQPEWAMTAAHQAGLVNSYSDPGRMGVDRWLAMLAAFHRANDSVCVIDCGSALTLDLVAADGYHLGGYITPGLQLLKKSILANTERISLDKQADGSSLIPGKSTEQAVNNGLLLMTVGAIEKALDQFIKLEKHFTIYMTGGDAEMMERMLSVGVILEKDLVLEGLQIALP